MATEYKRNPVTGVLEACTVPDTSSPPPTSTDKGVVITDPDSGNTAEISDDGEISIYDKDSDPIKDLLTCLIEQQKLTNLYLSEILGDTLEI